MFKQGRACLRVFAQAHGSSQNKLPTCEPDTVARSVSQSFDALLDDSSVQQRGFFPCDVLGRGGSDGIVIQINTCPERGKAFSTARRA